MKDKLAYLAGLFDGEGCVTYKSIGMLKEKIDLKNIIVGEYRWK